MEALLGALGRDPAERRRRRLLQATAAFAALALFGGLAWSARHRSQLCTGADRKLAGIWDPARHEAVHRAFEATHLPFAAAEWTSLEKGLDRWAGEWVAGHTDACEATRLRGEQSEETLTLRMECLDRRLAEGRALGTLLEAPDAKLIERAAETVAALSSPADCGDVARLRAGRRPLPPEKEALAVSVRDGIARAKVLTGAARFKDMQALTKKTLEAARALGEGPLLVEALGQDGWISQRMGDLKTSEARLRECFLLAMSIGSDDLGAKCTAQLGMAIGDNHARVEEALSWFDIGDAVAHRVGDRPEDRYRLLGGRAIVEGFGGQLKQATGHFKEALEQNELAGDRARPDRAALFGAMGGNYLSLGERALAAEAFRESVALREGLGGKDHPSLIASRTGLAAVLVDTQRDAEALALLEMVIPASDAVYGKRHSWSIYSRKAAGQALYRLDRLAEAEVRLDEVLELSDLTHPSFLIATVYSLLARIRAEQKRWPEALAFADKALAVAESVPGGITLGRPFYTRTRAEMLFGAGRIREALPIAEEGLRTLQADRKDRDPLEVAVAQDVVGEILWEEGKDRARSRELVSAALDGFRLHLPGSKEEGRLVKWLEAHPRAEK
jgi:tetratricopeptide (TPR) repeat protein